MSHASFTVTNLTNWWPHFKQTALRLLKQLRVRAFLALLFLGLALIVAFPLFSPIRNPSEELREKASAIDGPVRTVQTSEVDQVLTVGNVRWRCLDIKKLDFIARPDGPPTVPTGTFVLIKLEAQLIGPPEGAINARQFEITDSDKRRFIPDLEAQAALALAGLDNLFYRTIAADQPIAGYVVFDVAKGAKGLKLKVKGLDQANPASGYYELRL